MNSIYGTKQIEGLEVLAVVSEDGGGAPATLEFCQEYANQTGFDPARMVFDPSFETLFQRMANGGNGGIGLPWDGVLDGRGMLYVYNSEQGQVAPYTAVEELLGKD